MITITEKDLEEDSKEKECNKMRERESDIRGR